MRLLLYAHYLCRACIADDVQYVGLLPTVTSEQSVHRGSAKAAMPELRLLTAAHAKQRLHHA